MKFYRFDQKTLQFKIVHINKILHPLIVFTTTFIILSTSVEPRITEAQLIKACRNYEKQIKIIHNKQFNEESLINKLKELNVRFPEIALAQAMIESNNYKSRIFKENNNLFGMREAKMRINLAKGTQYNHAYYDNWEESVLDYAFWISTYTNGMNRAQVLLFLDQVYAEGSRYDLALENKIKQNKLQNKFN